MEASQRLKFHVSFHILYQTGEAKKNTWWNLSRDDVLQFIVRQIREFCYKHIWYCLHDLSSNCFKCGRWSVIMDNKVLEVVRKPFRRITETTTFFHHNWSSMFTPLSREDVLFHLCMMAASWWLTMLGRSPGWWMWRDFWCCWMEHWSHIEADYFVGSCQPSQVIQWPQFSQC